MNNDLFTKHFTRKRGNKSEAPTSSNHGSPESQQSAPPVVKSNGSTGRLNLRRPLPLIRGGPGTHKTYSSSVAALNTYQEASQQSSSPSLRPGKDSSEIEATIVSKGVHLWKEFCTSKEYQDDDRVTPEKLLEYVEIICLPYDDMQRRQDTAKQDQSYPLLVLSLQALVRPVLHLWLVQKNGLTDADMEPPEEQEQEQDHGVDERSAVEERELDASNDMDVMEDIRQEYEPDMPWDADPGKAIDEHEESIEWLKKTAGELEANLGPSDIKEEEEIKVHVKLSTPPSTSATLAWTPGRYKAEEFIASTTTPIVVQPADKDSPIYELADAGKVVDILEEWRFGTGGHMSIQDLTYEYGARWREREAYRRYLVRLTVVREFKRLVLEESMDDDEAVKVLVSKQGSKASGTFYNELCVERAVQNKEARREPPTWQSDSSSTAFSEASLSSPGTSNVSTASLTSGKLASKKATVTTAASHITKSSTPASAQTPHAAAKVEATAPASSIGTKLSSPARTTAARRSSEKAPTLNTNSNPLTSRFGFQRVNVSKAQYCERTPGMPEDWDNVVLDRTYRFPIFNDIVTVDDLWTFWTGGWDEGPSVRARSVKHGATWKKAAYDPTIAHWYQPRYKIIQEIQRLVQQDWTEAEAVEGIEGLRKELSLERLATHLESLDDIPVAITQAKNPSAHAELMALFKSSAASMSSGQTPDMGHVGGRCAPRTHPELTATTREPALETVSAPTVCRSEDPPMASTCDFARSGTRGEPGTVSGTDSAGSETGKGIHALGYFGAGARAGATATATATATEGRKTTPAPPRKLGSTTSSSSASSRSGDNPTIPRYFPEQRRQPRMSVTKD
ncbi:hypothetical protein BGX33_006404 [Mortierella sp. NVP41]|nr:hypothetical protein BGX33_006404 [Mortierella sp. NVP41]